MGGEKTSNGRGAKAMENGKKYTDEYKCMVVRTMRSEKLSYGETARRFGITGHHTLFDWVSKVDADAIVSCKVKQSVSKNGASERRQRLKEQLGNFSVDELRSEVLRLRAENDYLKKVRALVLKQP
jgi:transposase-like protein